MTRRWLAGLLLVGFLMRLSGILWGIPLIDAGYYHPDEPKVIRGACSFPRDVVERTDLRYPTFCHYSLGTLVLPLRAFFAVTGHSPFRAVYLIGRLLSVLAGTATILLVYLLARRTDDSTHAWIAAPALAFSLFHVTHSAWATTDVTSSFLLTAFLLLLLMAFDSESRRLSIAAGIALGLLVGTKYTGAVAVVPLLILAIGRHSGGEDSSIRNSLAGAIRDPRLWIIVIVGLVTFLVSTPGILIHPQAFLDSILYEQSRLADLQEAFSVPSIIGHQCRVLARTIGIPLAAAALVGLLLSLFRPSSTDIALAALVVAFFVYFREGLLGRYVILVMPVLAIFVSRGLLWWNRSRSRALRFVGGALAVIVLSHAAVYSMLGVLSRYPDTRTQATRFIAREVPPGASIGIAYTSSDYPWPAHRWRYPVIDFERHPYEDFLESPDYLVVSSYDADRINQTIRQATLSEDFRLPDHLHGEWYRGSPPSPEIFEVFYELYFADDSSYQLVASFEPTRLWAPIEQPPPTIAVFRSTSNRSSPAARDP